MNKFNQKFNTIMEKQDILSEAFYKGRDPMVRYVIETGRRPQGIFNIVQSYEAYTNLKADMMVADSNRSKLMLEYYQQFAPKHNVILKDIQGWNIKDSAPIVKWDKRETALMIRVEGDVDNISNFFEEMKTTNKKSRINTIETSDFYSL